MEKFDIIFNDDNHSNNLGFALSKEEAIDYVQTWNGSEHVYFKDYKGGSVSVFNIETGEEVYSEVIK